MGVLVWVCLSVSFSTPENPLLGEWLLTDVKAEGTVAIAPAGGIRQIVTSDRTKNQAQPHETEPLATYAKRKLNGSSFRFTESEFEFVRIGKAAEKGTWKWAGDRLELTYTSRKTTESYRIGLKENRILEMQIDFDGHPVTLVYSKQ